MNNYKYILLGIFLCLANILYAQGKITIRGNVYSAEMKQPLAGVQIYSQTAKKSVESDSLGEFIIEVADPTAIMRFQRDGYLTKEIPLLNKKYLNVYLDRTNKFLNNVDYVHVNGKERIEHKKGNSTTLSHRDLISSYTTPDLALVGRIPGMEVVHKSGMNGEGTFIQVRGQRSLLADNAPLVVVDGVPLFNDKETSSVIDGFSRGSFVSINLKDVANVTLLKGADAAIYGSLGSNGVLLIETHRSKVTETEVSFHTVEGVSILNRRLSLLQSDEFKGYMSDIAITRYNSINTILSEFPFLKDDPKDPNNYLYVNNTDWQDEVYDRGFTSENVLKVLGGDAIAKYALSVGVVSNKGVLNNTKQSDYFTRLNADINVSRKVKIFANASFNYSEYQLKEQGLLPKTSPFLAALNQYPVLSVYKKDRNQIDLPHMNPTADMFGLSSPNALLSSMKANNKSFDIMVTLGGNIMLTSHLTADVMLGVYYNYVKENLFIPGNTAGTIASINDGVRINTLRAGTGEGLGYYLKGGLKYTHNFGAKHKINSVLAYQFLSNKREMDAGSGVSIKSDFYKTLSNSESSYGRQVVGYLDKWNWISGYWIFSYNYNYQYYLSTQVVADASSVYGPSHAKVEILPSIQAAWSLKHSNIFKNIDGISEFKLRAEYGLSANSQFSNKYGRYYYQTVPYRDLAGLIRVGLPNSKIGPEKVNFMNFGVDFALLNNRIQINADYYEEKTKDLLVDKSMGAAYGDEVMYDNCGELTNKGYDINVSLLLLNARNISFRVGGNIGHYTTKVNSLGGDNERLVGATDGTTLRSVVNGNLNAFYGHSAHKVIQSTTEAKQLGLVAHSGSAFEAGDVQFVDYNNDLIINDADRVELGKATPDYFGGFYGHVQWKGFSILANFSYSQGNKIVNAIRRNGESMNDFVNQFSTTKTRWRQEGQGTTMPRAVYGDPMGNARFSSRWIEDGSFVKFKELSVGYEFNRNVLFFTGLKIYATGENLFTWTKYVGMDPEFAYSYDPQLRGIDVGKVALPKNVKIGLIANF